MSKNYITRCERGGDNLVDMQSDIVQCYNYEGYTL